MLCVGLAAIVMLFESTTMVSGQFNSFDYDYPDYFQFQPPPQQAPQVQQQVIANQRPTNAANGRRPRPRPRPATTSSTTPSSTTTAQPAQLAQCRQNCPVTSEYNPVCGTDGQSYNNMNVFRCAQACGVNVRIVRMGPCVPRPL